MFTHEESSELLDSTMDSLEGELSAETAQHGASIIDQWLAQLHQAENAKDLAHTLEQVKAQIQRDKINTNKLIQLLDSLATQTAEFSTFMGSEGDMAPDSKPYRRPCGRWWGRWDIRDKLTAYKVLETL